MGKKNLTESGIRLYFGHMKTIASTSPLIVSENMQGSVMGMDASGMNTATYFMRDKIYSDKILAVVREYACNAIDEHKKHKIDKAVEIGLRKEGNQIVFYVRDFAKGLSEEDIRNVFGMYFRSTKSKTNESIGGFGIGSKAGHCYSDTFFVSSFFNGEKSTYTCMLGGGDTGVPVGHIYKVDNCPTQEKGLEVSMPIKVADVYDFQIRINKFVLHSPARIFKASYQADGPLFPATTVASHKVDGFNIRLINHGESFGSFNHTEAAIQMGGVIYGSVNHHEFKTKNNHSLVVDVPIGSMSIPISRESFEGTQSNKKILERIKEIILDLAEKDVARFKSKDLIELTTDCLTDLSNKEYEGDMFRVYKHTLYKEVWPLASNVRQSNESQPLEQLKNKNILVLIPNNTASEYWVSKLISFSKGGGRNYLFVNERELNSIKIDVSDKFKITKIKSLDFPKAKRESKKYVIFNERNCNLGQLSALELHNKMRKTLNLDEAQDEKEALKQNKEYLKSINSLYELKNITIAIKSNGKFNKIGYYCSSNIFLENIKSLGWIGHSSPEFHAKHNELKNKEDEMYRKSSVRAAAQPRHIKLSSRTVNLIEKNHKNANKIAKFWEILKGEQSLRSSLIDTICNAGYSGRIYSRSEIRSILLIK